MAKEPTAEKKGELLFGGMARWDGLDFFGPNYVSIAYRNKEGIHVRVEPSKVWRPEGPALKRFLKLPIVRSVFFWGRLVVQMLGSVWALISMVATLGVLWLFVRLLEFGSGAAGGAFGGILGFFAEFPILPMLLVFFATLKFSPMGRYHGAEHKAVAAYEKYGEVTLGGAMLSSRIHPRCGTNILSYIVLASLLDPFIAWPGYAVLQFLLISELWFTFGQTRPSIAIGNFMQRYFTTTEPTRRELEVAVESLERLVRAEEEPGEAVQAPPVETS